MPRYDYVLLDADNTLFDFDRAEHRALTLTLEAHGYPVNEETKSCYLAANASLWAQFERGEVTQSFLVVERFAAFLRAMGGSWDPAELNQFYLSRLAEGADLLPGAEALCRALAPHCTLAIVTNGVARAQRGRMARSPLAPLFHWLFISEELGFQKPQPEFFAAVLNAMEIHDKTRVIVVGDNLRSDILGGRNAGLDTLWYHPSGLPNDTELLPTYEAANFSAVQAFILGQ